MIFVSNAMRYFISNRYACGKTIIWNFKICRITILRFNIFSTSLSIFDALIPDLQKVKSKSIDCAIDAAFLIFSIALSSFIIGFAIYKHGDSILMISE